MCYNMNYLREHDYDRAAAMCGIYKDTRACLTEKRPTSLYAYCVSHILGLASSNAITVMERLKGYTKIHRFFDSPNVKLFKKIIFNF